MQRLNSWHAVLATVFAFLLNVQQHDFVQADEPAIRSVTDLERIPVGIKVVQSPEMAKAVKKLPVDGRRGEYSWVYRTEVTALDKDLTIVEFGAFHWDGAEWQLGPTSNGTPYGTKEFAEWYSCEDGVLKKGQSASDPVNWNSLDELVPGKAKWFFIGMDETGKKYRGDAVVEFAPELGERSPLEPLVRFSGHWKKQWKLLPSEWIPAGQSASGTHSGHWSLNGRFLKEEGQDSDGSTYLSMYSYDEAASQYLLTVFQSRGATTRMTGTWDEEKLTMTWRNTEQPGLTSEWKYRLVDSERYEFEFVTRGDDKKLYLHIKGTADRVVDGNQ